jgi:gas vesicle protein
MAQGESSGGFFAGFLFGAFVGATLALLFAPAPGEELRKQIREKSIELKDQAGDFSIDAGKTAEQLREKGQTLLEEQKARFAEAIEDGKQAAARKKEELLAQLEAARAGDDSIEVAEQDA